MLHGSWGLNSASCLRLSASSLPIRPIPQLQKVFLFVAGRSLGCWNSFIYRIQRGAPGTGLEPRHPRLPSAGGEFTGLHLAVTAPTPLGRGEEALLRQHLRCPDPVLLRVPGQHPAAGHHPAHRQARTQHPSLLTTHPLDPFPTVLPQL